MWNNSSGQLKLTLLKFSQNRVAAKPLKLRNYSRYILQLMTIYKYPVSRERMNIFDGSQTYNIDNQSLHYVYLSKREPLI